ncbi:MAG: RdgB/HAM1 family non-canonical purine NTP pyrophosphatase [Steroidobacteraceae bacterium]
MRVVLATGNLGKLREFADLLGPAGLEFEPLSAFGIDSPEETGATFVENALLKARHAASLTGLPAMADDSGLEVDALGGAPGVRSARYAAPPGSHASPGDAANTARLLRELQGIAPAARRARFRCAIVLLRDAYDPAPLVGEGAWEGRILEVPRGQGGFGYDPVFEDLDSGRSAAELAPADKHARSHRGAALRAVLAQLRARGA